MTSLEIPLLGGLAALGSYLSSSGKAPRRKKKIRQEIPRDELPSSVNLYHNNHYNASRVDEFNLADKRFQQSFDPIHTNVIPAFYNTIYLDKCGNPDVPAREKTNCPTILPGSDKITTPEMVEKERRIFNGPMFSKSVHEEHFANPGGQELSDLTGLPMDKCHNNMVPFFGAKLTQNMDPNVNQQTLERFTGTGDIANRHKREIAPMFELDRENIYGTPNVPEELRLERYVESNMKTNILPSAQQRVQPLIGIEKIRPNFEEYYSIGNIRTKTNPKIVYRSRPEAPPKALVTNRGLIGAFKKNHRPRGYAYGPDRMTPAYAIAPREHVRPDFEEALKCENRTTGVNNENYFGGAVAKTGLGFEPRICRPRANPNNNAMFNKFL